MVLDVEGTVCGITLCTGALTAALCVFVLVLIIGCGGCGSGPLQPHERLLLLHPMRGTWQHVAVGCGVDTDQRWFTQSLMLNHAVHGMQDGDVVAVMGGGNCFSFGTHFDRQTPRFRIADADLASVSAAVPADIPPHRAFVRGLHSIQASTFPAFFFSSAHAHMNPPHNFVIVTYPACPCVPVSLCPVSLCMFIHLLVLHQGTLPLM